MSLFAPRKIIKVEAKVMGLLGGDYLSIMKMMDVPEGSTVRDLLKAMLDVGHIDKAIYASLKNLKPPIGVLINGESAVHSPKRGLCEGDIVSITTPISGG